MIAPECAEVVPVHFLTDGPPDSKDVLVLAHGAGGPMNVPFMNTVARGVAQCGIRVVRFEFLYMAARREGGRRGTPDREPVLLQSSCFLRSRRKRQHRTSDRSRLFIY